MHAVISSLGSWKLEAGEWGAFQGQAGLHDKTLTQGIKKKKRKGRRNVFRVEFW